jgi:uncharacterized repeat protein (TIGR01451 family)
MMDNTVITNVVSLSDPVGHVYQRAAATRYRSADLTNTRKDVSLSQVQVGDTVTYTITIINSGGGATSFAATDTLPAALSFVSGSLQAGHGVVSYDPEARQIVWSGDLAGQYQTYLRFAARVQTSGVITNTVQIRDSMARLIERSAVVTAATPVPTVTPTATATPGVTETPSATPTGTVSATATPSATATATVVAPLYRLFLPVVISEYED